MANGVQLRMQSIFFAHISYQVFIQIHTMRNRRKIAELRRRRQNIVDCNIASCRHLHRDREKREKSKHEIKEMKLTIRLLSILLSLSSVVFRFSIHLRQVSTLFYAYELDCTALMSLVVGDTLAFCRESERKSPLKKAK